MRCSLSCSETPFKESYNYPSTLTLQEGKSLLQQLLPGSAEYTHLQNLLLKTIGIFEITIKETSYKIDTVSDHCQLLGGFGGSEHAHIGEAVTLQGLKNQTILMVGDIPLEFSHIVALAGDFYAIPGKAISLPGGDDAAKTARFENAFNELVDADVKELNAILIEIKNESREVKESGTPHRCYSHCSAKGMKTLKQIKKNYQELLIDNSDHFEENAQDAYRIGHKLALQVARNAGKTGDEGELKRAYALDAFACHFLTDLFAAGHVRNQRGKLETFLISYLKTSLKANLFFKQASILKISKMIAGLLTGAQHEVDGKNGLNVQDKQGNHWTSYGDGFYFSPQSTTNQTRVIEAAQASANEIYQAYENHGAEPNSDMTRFIPKAVSSNASPLYEIRDNSLILYKNGVKQQARKGIFLIKDILDCSLDSLPQHYINGVLFPEKELSPWNSKVVDPLFRKIMGSFWRMAGVATYDQMETEFRQLNEKVDEAASLGKHTYDNMILILEESRKLNSNLDASKDEEWLNFKKTKAQIEDGITNIETYFENFSNIKDVNHSDHSSNPTLISLQSTLLKDILKLSTLCAKRNQENKGVLLTCYQRQLRLMVPQPSDQKVALFAALWLRENLEFQEAAFGFYQSSTGAEDKRQYSSVKVVETARDFFTDLGSEENLVNYSSSYINLQLKKIALLEGPSFQSTNKE